MHSPLALRPNVRRKRALAIAAAFSAALFFLLLAAHAWWLAGLGHFLVKAEPPSKADAILVLAGDVHGLRVRKAAEIAQQGYAPRVLVSGPMQLYGVNEADLSIAFATAAGFPASLFVPLRCEALSTSDEAKCFGRELERRGVHRLLIVTSDYHTRRAGRTFYKYFPHSIDIHMVAAPDKYWRAESWWRYREARKITLIEWLKTVASTLGI